MKANMDKIIPIFAAIGVGFAAYQMFSGNGGKMKNIMPLASNMMFTSLGKSTFFFYFNHNKK